MLIGEIRTTFRVLQSTIKTVSQNGHLSHVVCIYQCPPSILFMNCYTPIATSMPSLDLAI